MMIKPTFENFRGAEVNKLHRNERDNQGGFECCSKNEATLFELPTFNGHLGENNI